MHAVRLPVIAKPGTWNESEQLHTLIRPSVRPSVAFFCFMVELDNEAIPRPTEHEDWLPLPPSLPPLPASSPACLSLSLSLSFFLSSAIQCPSTRNSIPFQSLEAVTA